MLFALVEIWHALGARLVMTLAAPRARALRWADGVARARDYDAVKNNRGSLSLTAGDEYHSGLSAGRPTSFRINKKQWRLGWRHRKGQQGRHARSMSIARAL